MAAAALFVAVRWDTLGDQAKLGILVAVTAACGLAGRSLRPTVPVAARVLTHLAALDVAAVAVHLARGGGVDPLWPPVLAAASVTAAAVWWLVGRAEDSSVLRAGAAVAVVPAAAGLGGTVGVPAGVLLIGAAALAALGRRHLPAIAWSVVAGLAPVVASALAAVELDRLGLGLGVAGVRGVAALAVGLVAAVVLAVEARRTERPALLVVALAAAGVGVAALRAEVEPAPGGDLLGLAGVLLGAELAAVLVRRDPFWRRPLARAALVAEVVVAAALPVLALSAVLTFVWDPDGRPAVALAGVVAGLAWWLADVRRTEPAPTSARSLVTGGSWWPMAPLVAMTVVPATLAATTTVVPVAAVAVALGAALVVARRPAGDVVAVPLVVGGAAGLAVPGLGAGSAAAVAGTLVLALAAGRRHRLDDPEQQAWAWLLALAGLGPAAAAAVVVGPTVPVTVALVAGCWLVGGAVVDAMAPAPRPGPGTVLRWGAAAAVALGGMVALDVAAGRPVVGAGLDGRGLGALGLVAGLVSLGLVLDAVRRDDPLAAGALAATLPVLVAAPMWSLGYPTTEVGLGLCVAALVVGGLGLLVPDRWEAPTWVVTGMAVALGVALAAGNPSTRSTALLLVGGLVLAEGVARRWPWALGVGGLLGVVGTWGHLEVAGVGALDAWVAPVAAVLVVAAVLGERERASSWLTFGPPAALLGGAALVERLAGGSGVHAVVAGAVGVAAVALGGGRRLVAPLLIGTGLLAVLTVHESLVVTAEVPAWMWLAVGGVTLLSAGIALERHESGPVEVGQRLVDVVRTRYR